MVLIPETNVMKNGSGTVPLTVNIAVAFGEVASVCAASRVGNAVNGSSMLVGGQDAIKADASVKTVFGLAGVPTIFADGASSRLDL